MSDYPEMGVERQIILPQFTGCCSDGVEPARGTMWTCSSLGSWAPNAHGKPTMLLARGSVSGSLNSANHPSTNHVMKEMTMPSFDLTNRAAIVTGGSQGFGKAIAIALAGQGANVAVVAREPEVVTVGRQRPHESVAPVVEEIKAVGSRAIGITADVREQEQVDSMVADTMDAFGRIDILINVVGGSWGETFRSGPLVELEPHDFIECYRVNVLTGFMCSKAVQPIMNAQGKGAIVNVASGAGVNPGTGQASYGAAKAAVINMSKAMAYEWAPEIRVNAIALGGIETPHRPMWAEAVQQSPATRNALARLGTPDEHAGTVLWLVSDAASFITGETVAADGGRR